MGPAAFSYSMEPGLRLLEGGWRMSSVQIANPWNSELMLWIELYGLGDRGTSSTDHKQRDRESNTTDTGCERLVPPTLNREPALDSLIVGLARLPCLGTLEKNPPSRP